ncbi:hypothetical protein LMG28138_05877 [Pararobbsia alpina]|uniref:Uncharacterized protein n=1 Tax=Pararobbsia alpina TaxID=621374 RepID=A0A6S7BNA1_9BURK|nr:hypothetical protein LMG28138_05877 [Pararobbsia alpina]
MRAQRSPEANLAFIYKGACVRIETYPKEAGAYAWSFSIDGADFRGPEHVRAQSKQAVEAAARDTAKRQIDGRKSNFGVALTCATERPRYTEQAIMPTNAFRYTFEELVFALLREQGITTGRWALSLEFIPTAATMKPNESLAIPLPAIVFSVTGATLTRVDDPNTPGVDASRL